MPRCGRFGRGSVDASWARRWRASPRPARVAWIGRTSTVRYRHAVRRTEAPIRRHVGAGVWRRSDANAPPGSGERHSQTQFSDRAGHVQVVHSRSDGEWSSPPQSLPPELIETSHDTSHDTSQEDPHRHRRRSGARHLIPHRPGRCGRRGRLGGVTGTIDPSDRADRGSDRVGCVLREDALQPRRERSWRPARPRERLDRAGTGSPARCRRSAGGHRVRHQRRPQRHRGSLQAARSAAGGSGPHELLQLLHHVRTGRHAPRNGDGSGRRVDRRTRRAQRFGDCRGPGPDHHGDRRSRLQRNEPDHRHDPAHDEGRRDRSRQRSRRLLGCHRCDTRGGTGRRSPKV